MEKQHNNLVIYKQHLNHSTTNGRVEDPPLFIFFQHRVDGQINGAFRVRQALQLPVARVVAQPRAHPINLIRVRLLVDVDDDVEAHG